MRHLYTVLKRTPRHNVLFWRLETLLYMKTAEKIGAPPSTTTLAFTATACTISDNVVHKINNLETTVFFRLFMENIMMRKCRVR
jgi:hypothetical protein